MNGIVLILLVGVCAVVTGATDPPSLYHDEKYDGCFKDNEADRALDGFYTTLPTQFIKSIMLVGKGGSYPLILFPKIYKRVISSCNPICPSA